jgi:hypothetical protein
MLRRRIVLRIVLGVALVLALSGMVCYALGESPALRKVGVGIFIAAGVAYVGARFAMIREDHFR